MKSAQRFSGDSHVSRDPDSVRAMFGRIARRYDLANHLLSGGADFLWRRRAAKIVASWRPRDVLDLATGSGDLALTIATSTAGREITAADFSPEMLEIARGKGVANTVLADALQLPFESGSFDAVTVAFGLRNMADWDPRPCAKWRGSCAIGGHLLVLDFSLPTGASGRPTVFICIAACRFWLPL